MARKRFPGDQGDMGVGGEDTLSDRIMMPGYIAPDESAPDMGGGGGGMQTPPPPMQHDPRFEGNTLLPRELSNASVNLPREPNVAMRQVGGSQQQSTQSNPDPSGGGSNQAPARPDSPSPVAGQPPAPQMVAPPPPALPMQPFQPMARPGMPMTEPNVNLRGAGSFLGQSMGQGPGLMGSAGGLLGGGLGVPRGSGYDDQTDISSLLAALLGQ